MSMESKQRSGWNTHALDVVELSKREHVLRVLAVANETTAQRHMVQHQEGGRHRHRCSWDTNKAKLSTRSQLAQQ